MSEKKPVKQIYENQKKIESYDLHAIIQSSSLKELLASNINSYFWRGHSLFLVQLYILKNLDLVKLTALASLAVCMYKIWSNKFI